MPYYQALNNYMLKMDKMPFEWGVHDCFMFANSACKEFVGKGFIDCFIGDPEAFQYTTPEEGLKLQIKWLRINGFKSVEEAFDYKFQRLHLNSAPRGSLVMRVADDKRFLGGHMLGISVGPSQTFVSEKDGLIFSNYDKDDKVWSVL